MIKNFIAATAIPPHRVVALAAGENEVELATDVTDPFIGTSAEPATVATGGRIDVTFNGIEEVEAGGAVSKGARLTVDAQGRVVTSSEATNSVIGRALTAANAAGDIISVEIDKD
ncbi:DUF2190 family protein [Idiomarina xiamenensis]|uniref:DUF2190 family protein n=1 Tax=Idiomarina xiamenensis TaxID=1207041 RepID=UPI001ED9AA7E|nr:DUF2190 family protein [Idiomarina xiamenensis]